MKEEVLVCGNDLLDIVVADRPLSRNAFAFQPLLQNIWRRLKINDQIRSSDLLAEELIVAVVKRQLGVGQVDVGEQLILFKQVNLT